MFTAVLLSSLCFIDGCLKIKALHSPSEQCKDHTVMESCITALNTVSVIGQQPTWDFSVSRRSLTQEKLQLCFHLV